MSMTPSTKSRGIEVVTAALVAALIVSNPCSLVAQQREKILAGATSSVIVTQQKTKPEEEDTASSPEGPGLEGIKVTGHWIMDVHDKDGRLIEHRDFHNSLYANGAGILLRLLDGTAVAEKFAILLVQTGSTSNPIYSIIPTGSVTASTLCGSGYICSTGLTQTLKQTTQTGNPTSLVIAGQLTATQAVTFGRVISDSTMCHNGPLDNNSNSQNQDPISTSPSQCVAGTYTLPIQPGGGYFTGTDITPLSLAAGQVLSVSVSISFS
jgi:hypothetical protein